jgi:hypothetical protein
MGPPRFALIALAFAACTPPPAPSDDDCATPGTGTLTALAVGPGPDSAAFVAWNDGDAAHLVVGPQGATMLVARLQASGTAPMCLPESLRIDDASGTEITRVDRPLNLYANVTHSIYLPGVYPAAGQSIHLSATSLGATTAVALTVAR